MCSSSRSKLFQGFTKGNGVDLLLWMLISVILVMYIYLKSLANPQYSHESSFMFTLIVSIHVDDTELNALNIEDKSTLEVIELDQKILYSWQFYLSISGGDLKLDKCSWTMQDYY